MWNDNQAQSVMLKVIRLPVFLFLASFLCVLVLFEVLARVFIIPSTSCYGIFLGRELPPYMVHSKRTSKGSESSLYLISAKPLTVDGDEITSGDLWGIRREDAHLGYAPQENSISVNGWSQINSLGAHSRRDLPKERTPGKKRILTLGDSYTQCSRVRLEESWPFFLEYSDSGLEVVNFGVEGYSLAQTFLKYEMVKRQIDHDLVLLMFVPHDNLWRDINMWRTLWGWSSANLMPRFEIGSGGELVLIRSPYRNRAEFMAANKNRVSPELSEFLRQHDRFYFPANYEPDPFGGSLITYKLLVKAWSKLRLSRMRNDLYDPGKEALRLSRKMISALRNSAALEHSGFVLVFLPSPQEISLYRRDKDYRNRWNKMVRYASGDGAVRHIDLLPELCKLSRDNLDYGYDGSHYGARTNAAIAEIIRQRLSAMSE
ncbi:MAG TPA: hypothetical protein PLP17_10320 [Oligoflexia bacterium]|nr:hypothetical protein [Oligoflexia bacterium]